MKQAWEADKEETVVNCFRHCGMQATVAEPSEDPFKDLDENEAQLEDLVASNGHQSRRVDVEDEVKDEESDEEPPASTITTYTEAIKTWVMTC